MDLDDKFTLTEARALLEGDGTKLMANSLRVAEQFGKFHRDVIRDIDKLDCSVEFFRLNFVEKTYIDKRGLQEPMFNMTRDGFSLLVMGFTGGKAMLWKERYIQAFNMLEAAAHAASIKHAETRGRSKRVRVAATDSYKLHGATEWYHYVNNTDAIYEIVFGASAVQLRKRWGLAKKANIRDHLNPTQLDTIIQIENAVTLQLDARKIINPDDQLIVVEHVARAYKALMEDIIPGIQSAA